MSEPAAGDGTAGVNSVEPRSRVRRQPIPWLGPLIALLAVYLLFVALSPDTFARSANILATNL